MLEFWIEADSFMRHMNRVLVGTMLEVASRRRSVADFAALLAGAPRRRRGSRRRPAGLYFVAAGYGGERVLAVTLTAGRTTTAIVCRTTAGNKLAAFLDECSIWKWCVSA